MLSQDSSTKSNQSSFDTADEEYGESELERALALKAKEQNAEEESNDELSASALYQSSFFITDEEYGENEIERALALKAKEEKAEEETNDKLSALALFKYFYSTILLIFCVAVVHASLIMEQTVGVSDNNIPWVAALIFFWFLMVWLAVMEGGQGDIVGLQHIGKEQYAESHPYTLKNTQLAHKGDNMARFIVGRQFLTFLVIFLSNMMGSTVEGAEAFGLPETMNKIFLDNGLAMILFVVTVGQLTSQVNAAQCMLDFINNRFMLYAVSYPALVIEASGLLHSVYLVQVVFSKVAGTTIESKEPPRNKLQTFLFWGKVAFSTVILTLSFAVVLEALFSGKTAMWSGVPPYVSVIGFFLIMSFVGMLAGLQIAMFSVMRLPESEVAKYPRAKKNCELILAGENLEQLIIGRQIWVTVCMFVVARITSIQIDEEEENIFGVSASLQKFFDSGILGAIITTICAALAWRIIASLFPLAFLSNPLIYVIIQLCLFIASTGICSSSIVLARIQKKFAGYKDDENYIKIDDFEDTSAIEDKSRHLKRRDSLYFKPTLSQERRSTLRRTAIRYDPDF